MSSKEIFGLRRDGNLIAAYKFAKIDLLSTPDDEWIKKAFSWVLIDYIKLATEKFEFEKFENYSNELFALNLSIEEKMLYENYSWIVYKWLLKFNELTNDIEGKAKHLDNDNELTVKINAVFGFIKKIKLEKPNKLYSVLYRIAIKLFPDWETLDWFGLNFFLKEDYLPYKMQDGEILLSLVEKAFVFYSKKILKDKSANKLMNNNYIDNVENYNENVNQDRINNFLPLMDEIIEKHPEYTNLPLYKVKLLLAIQEKKEDILNFFIPFARKNKNEFWVWSLMSDLFMEDDCRKLACLCKSLSCNTKDEFLVKTHQKIAELLIDLQLYDEAKVEIKKVLEIRRKKGWDIPPTIMVWMKNDWYSNAIEVNNNVNFYLNYNKKAEEILF
ncbi:MAG: DUF7017 domain-containing protein [Bacteroidales bacterium]